MKHIFYTMLTLLSLPAFTRESSIPVSPAYTADSLANPSPRNWPLSGGNLYNQRYSPLSQINRDNVDNLKGVWRTHLNGSGLEPKYSAEAPPVVHDGVMYISTGANDVFALGVESGEILWQFAANINATITSVCCGWNNRGVAIGDGRVYTGLLDGRLVALDQKTGDIAWDIQAERWQEGFSITSAPVYFDDMVIVGFAGADRGTRGRIKAYDAKDGSLLWTFYTIPGPGEPGFESWPQDNDFWQYGGASLWQVPAVDPELDMVYFSTGNAGPDYTGRYRAGDNLYSASIVAIDAHTGEYRWHFQQVHHDIWDYDASNPVVLFDAVINGRLRKGIVEVGKTGFAYILDRETGEPLIGIEEREVPQDPRQATAATQPYPLGESVIPQHLEIPPLGMELVNEGRIFTPFYGAEPVIVRPGIWGGASWPPSSYDPERALLYVCASDFAGSYTGGQDELQEPDYSKAWLGGRSGPAVTARIGQFVAMDVRTNTAAWRVQWPDQCYSGSVATGGGLVFTGRNDGHLIALDSDNGRQLWTFQTGAGANAPGTVFEHKGKQYVAVLSGGNALIGSARGDSVWLFGLDGTLDEAEPGDTPLVPAVAMAGEASTNVGEPDLANGESIYQQTCHQCHGDDGKGGHGGGAPLNALKDLLTVMTTVRDGRNDKMPALGAALSAEQIRDVSAYVLDAFTE